MRFRLRRPGVRQVLLVASDGDYTNYEETIAARDELMNKSISIFTIGE